VAAVPVAEGGAGGRPGRRYNDGWNNVPVFPESHLRMMRDFHEEFREISSARAASAKQSLAPGAWRDLTRKYLGPLERSDEVLSALDAQIAHPDRSYLTNVYAQGVVLDDGTLLRPKDIPGMVLADPASPGRIIDWAEMRSGPEGRTCQGVENKRWWTLLGSYDDGPGLTTGLDPTTTLSKQLGKEAALKAEAARLGRPRLRGTAFDGSRIDIDVWAHEFEESRPAGYRMPPDQ
jgi:hypothetical protein